MAESGQFLTEYNIKVKSIEQTLIPLIKQISTLVQHRSERSHISSERTLRAIGRVGQAVSLAVERFVTVGETIADDNLEIKQEMYEACKEARVAGTSIEQLCEIAATDPLGYSQPEIPFSGKGAMARAARTLLGAVTRVLLLADIVVVKQVLLTKDKVSRTLCRLESVANFTEFVKAFSVFGGEMVELAHVTGDRQNDLKDERRRAQMSAARQILERSTMMLLTSSKSCLRHPDCVYSKENRDIVFCQMRRAMDLIHFVVKDGVQSTTHFYRSSSLLNAVTTNSAYEWDDEYGTASQSLRNFSRLIEYARPRFEYNNHQPQHPSSINLSAVPLKSNLKDISSNNSNININNNNNNNNNNSNNNNNNNNNNSNNNNNNNNSNNNNNNNNNKNNNNSNNNNSNNNFNTNNNNNSNNTNNNNNNSNNNINNNNSNNSNNNINNNNTSGCANNNTSINSKNMKNKRSSNRDISGGGGQNNSDVNAICDRTGGGGGGDRNLRDHDEHGRRRDLIRSNSERERNYDNKHNYGGSVINKNRNCISFGSDMQNFRSSRNDAMNLELSILAPHMRENLLIALDKVVEKTQDFTDSAYTTHEHRENILLLCDRAKLELNQCLRIAVNMEQFPNNNFDIDSAIDSVLGAIHDLSAQLIMATTDQSTELNENIKFGIDLVAIIRNVAITQQLDRLQECGDRFHDYVNHVIDVCKLLRHIALTETLQVYAKFTENNLRIYGPQVVVAARALASYPSSNIVKENLEVFTDMWQWLTSDITSISKEIIKMTNHILSQPDQAEYLSLPRRGRHGTTAKPLKSVRLDEEEQEKIAKTGLEMKMLTNEMDAETDKWNTETEENNDIVKRAKNMSGMAFAMYQFTKGEGTLRTTQDLFTQAEYFAEEANRLYKVVRQFSYQVPAGDPKKELLDHLDKVPTYVQTLQFTVKDPTVGKAATFVKVDHVIRETKNLMDVINKVVTTCFDCANKYKLDFSGLSGRAASGGSRDDEGGTGAAGDSKGSSTSTEASM